jgi:hypothetical protein
MPQEIALDATTVYWTTFIAGYGMKAPLQGGTPTELAVEEVLPGKHADGFAI